MNHSDLIEDSNQVQSQLARLLISTYVNLARLGHNEQRSKLAIQQWKHVRGKIGTKWVLSVIYFGHRRANIVPDMI